MNEILLQIGTGALGLATVEMLLHARIARLLRFVVLVEESSHGLRVVLLAQGRQRVLLVEVVLGTGNAPKHLAIGEVGATSVSHADAVEIVVTLVTRNEARLNSGILMRDLLPDLGDTGRLLESLLLLDTVLLLRVGRITLLCVERGRR